MDYEKLFEDKSIEFLYEVADNWMNRQQKLIGVITNEENSNEYRLKALFLVLRNGARVTSIERIARAVLQKYTPKTDFPSGGVSF